MAKLPEDWNEMSVEEREDWVQWISREREEAEASYAGHSDARRLYCQVCGELLRYDSLAYHEGFHFDSCN